MLSSCARATRRGLRQLRPGDAAPVLGSSSSQSFLQGVAQQRSRNSILAHVKGIKRPTKLVEQEAEEDWDSDALYTRHQTVKDAPKPKEYSLAKANMELAYCVEKHRITNAFDVCKRMKEENVRPDLTTYNHVLALCAHHGAPSEARAILDDMQYIGVRPDITSFHHVMEALQCRETRGTWHLLQMMDSLGLEPDARTFDLIISRVLQSNNLELALQYLALMSTRGLVPLVNTAEGVIRAACHLNLPRLALDFAGIYEGASVRRLDGDVWMDCLIASAEILYVDGVRETWQKCVHELDIIPDEGCCIRVLNTAARAGLPQLGLDVIRVLQMSYISWEEHHFAPLVEAFSVAGEIKQAFELLGTMQTFKVTPNAGTAYPIYKAIAGSPEKLDVAWQAIDQLHTDKKTIDVSALNVVVRAAVRVDDDLQRSVGIYKAFSDFDVQPNIDTFNILLTGCINLNQRQLGDRLVAEMKEAGVKPVASTYERIIALCLTQATYEDAFYYLEEMKKENFIPSQRVYEQIIRKCVTMGDIRHQIALEEMLSHGYEVSENLTAFISGGGQKRTEDAGRNGEEMYAANRTTRPRPNFKKRERLDEGVNAW